jgi:hypothetical protein
MQVRLMTLADMAPIARASTHAAPRAGGAVALGTLAGLAAKRAADGRAAPVAPRNADWTRTNQYKLREYLQTLVGNFGYRDDYRGASPPFSVPYLPMPFAAQMLAHFDKQAKHWLGRSIPDHAKQPNFVKNRIRFATEEVVTAARTPFLSR